MRTARVAPPATARVLQRAIARAMPEPDADQRFVTGRGMTGHANTPDAVAEVIRQDLEAKGRLIRSSGARVG
jgi:molybdopterin biosynthesis enzyme MoaB